MKNKCKIVLYNPISVFFYMPLALLAIGSMFEQTKYEVVIIDGRLGNPNALLMQHLPQAICFGVTCLTGAPLKDAIEISYFVKETFPSTPIIGGGWHTSLFPTQPLKDLSCVDITVQGQGENTFKELVTAIETNTSLIDGISYVNKKGIIKRNKPRVLADLNEIPRIEYDLIDVEQYFIKKGRRQLDYISSAGCFFRCTFCADPFVFNRKFTAIDPLPMVLQLKDLYEKDKFTDINFQDETFFTYQKRINQIAQGLIDHGIKTTWAATLRADQGERMSDDEFELCVKSGLQRVLIGVESASQEMPDYLKKDIKLSQIKLSADRCKKHKINVIFPFIVGFPHETQENILASVRFIKKLRKMSSGFDTPIFYFKPYPGSEITQNMEKEGFKLPQKTKDWADFDYIGSSGPWVSKEKYDYFEKLKCYLKIAHSPRVPAILKPMRKLAQMRLKNDNYRFPIEKIISDAFIKSKKLS
jgi:anaerobic magnesium-protoporphyrin IX monomethyl ester cyclase